MKKDKWGGYCRRGAKYDWTHNFALGEYYCFFVQFSYWNTLLTLRHCIESDETLVQ